MGIGKAPAKAGAVAWAALRAVGPGVGAHPPCRPMARQAILLIGFHLCIAHACKVVVGGIELAHVFKTEPQVLPLAPSPHGGAVKACAAAGLPLADRCLWTHDLGVVGFDAHAVEVFRVELHLPHSMCAPRTPHKMSLKEHCAERGCVVLGPYWPIMLGAPLKFCLHVNGSDNPGEAGAGLPSTAP